MDNKKILLICVNYNSYDMLHELLKSIDIAAEKVYGKMQIDVFVADNSPVERLEDIHKDSPYIKVDCQHFDDNPGYLGAAQQIYNQYAHKYDYVSISNVDLTLNEDFFVELKNLNVPDNIGWLAPDIFTSADNKHENPYMLHRPTKRNFIVWNIIYSSALIYKIYANMRLLLKRHQSKSKTNTIIYAAHGSFMLFTKTFISYYPTLHFYSYMYGEEIYFAELMRITKLGVVYFPTLKINNVGHVNMRTLSIGRKSKWSKQSLKYLQQVFFK